MGKYGLWIRLHIGGIEMKNKKRIILFLVIYIIFILILNIVKYKALLFMGDSVDFLISRSSRVLKTVRNFLLLEIMVLIISMAADYFKLNVKKNTMKFLKSGYLNMILESDSFSLKEAGIGKFLSNFTNDMAAVESDFCGNLLDMIYHISNFVLGIVILMKIDYRFLIAILFISVGISVYIIKTASFLQEKYGEKSEIFGQYTSYVKEILSGYTIIKNNNLFSRVKSDFETVNKNVQDKGYEIDKFLTYISAIHQLIYILSFSVLLVMSLYMYKIGLITIGTIIIISNSSDKIISPTVMVTVSIPRLKGGYSILKRIIAKFGVKNDVTEKKKLRDRVKSIEFKNVQYDAGGKEIIKNFTYTFNTSLSYFIYGLSGSGKSTIVKLLIGYISPDSGEILINGDSISGIQTDDYYGRIQYVPQDIFLFEDTVLNNITMFSKCEQEKLNKAIELSGLNKFISELPAGLNTVITENGTNISGGEKRRIGIARAIVKDPDLIVLDEPFADLDSDIVEGIDGALLKLKDSGFIVISHIRSSHFNSYNKKIEILNGIISK